MGRHLFPVPPHRTRRLAETVPSRPSQARCPRVIPRCLARCHYRDALLRGVDPAGGSAFGQLLRGNQASREQVAEVVFGSPEYRRNLVGDCYQRFLHRAADESGLEFFTTALQRGARSTQILAGLIGSEEYQAQR